MGRAPLLRLELGPPRVGQDDDLPRIAGDLLAPLERRDRLGYGAPESSVYVPPRARQDCIGLSESAA